MKIVRKPYHLLLPGAIFFFVGGFLAGEPSFDFHFGDTYYVVTSIYVNWIPVFLLLLMWVGYSVSYRLLYSEKWVWIHIITTLAASFLLALMSFVFFPYQNLAGMPRRYYDYDTWHSTEIFGYLTTSSKIKVILLLVLIGAQVIYVLNVIVGLIKTARQVYANRKKIL